MALLRYNKNNNTYILIEYSKWVISDFVGMNEFEVTTYKIVKELSNGRWELATNKEFYTIKDCEKYIEEQL